MDQPAGGGAIPEPTSIKLSQTISSDHALLKVIGEMYATQGKL